MSSNGLRDGLRQTRQIWTFWSTLLNSPNLMTAFTKPIANTDYIHRWYRCNMLVTEETLNWWNSFLKLQRRKGSTSLDILNRMEIRNVLKMLQRKKVSTKLWKSFAKLDFTTKSILSCSLAVSERGFFWNKWNTILSKGVKRVFLSFLSGNLSGVVTTCEAVTRRWITQKSVTSHCHCRWHLSTKWRNWSFSLIKILDILF